MSDQKKKPKAKKRLTRKQQKFVNALAAGNSRELAVAQAGYSTKNPDQSAYQALKQVTKKVPELMDELGLTDRALIQNNLVPLLNATERKFFAHEGKVISQRDVAALNTRLNALDMAFRLRGSYAPKDPAETAQFGVKVIIVDAPRPRHDLVIPDIWPGDPLPVIPPLNGSNGNKSQE